MQSTHAGTNLCGIILDDGTDCPGIVVDDAPLNLCAPHLIAAATWAMQNDQSARPRARCELCGQREARIDPAGGTFCGRCGHQSPDFEGYARLTPVEEDQTNPRRYGRPPISVVYYIRFGDRIKIGTTRNPVRRMNELPHDEILAFEPGGIDVEAARHRQFRGDRIRNTEWFHAAREILEHAATLRRTETPWDDYRLLQRTRDTPRTAA